MPSKSDLHASTMFQQQFDSIRPALFLAETEETWDTIARSITTLTASCSEVASEIPTDVVATMRSISRPLINAMNSERGRLSGVAIDLVAVVASDLGSAFDPLIPFFFPVVLALSSRTSKVTVVRARTCIRTIIETTQLPSVLSFLLHSATDKSASLRLTVVEATLSCMNCFNPPDLEKDARAKEIEGVIRATVRDPNADVRKASRKIFEAHKLLLPSRLESFTTPLSPTTRKYLDIQGKPVERLPPSHPQPKIASLSSSTSALRAASSRRPQTHTRSASSPSVAEVGNMGPPTQVPSRNRDMPPPPLPKRAEPVQPSRQAAFIPRSASANDRQRVVSLSAAVRPTVSSTSSTKLSTSERSRPPVSTQSARRLLPVDNTQPTTTLQPTTAIESFMARRVPVAEPQPTPDGEKPTRARPRIDNTVSTPAIRLAAAPETKAAHPNGVKSAQPRIARSKEAPAMISAKTKEPAKQRSVTQPTLSQLSRAKTIERRVPVPAVSKPLWGKAAPRKVPIPAVKKGKQPVPSVVLTPAPQQTSTAEEQNAEDKEAVDEEMPATEQEAAEADNCATTGHKPEEDENTRIDSRSEPQIIEDQVDEVPAVTDAPPDSQPATPPKVEAPIITSAKTPISELLLSIEQGFLFTPGAPLSPAQSYASFGSALAIPFPLQPARSQSKEQDGESINKPFDGIHRPESRRALEDVEWN